MIRTEERRHAPRTTGRAAASLLFALALFLAPASALADDPPAGDAAGKSEEAKEHAEEAKAAGQEKAAEAKEAKEAKTKKAKSKEKSKKSTAKDAAANDYRMSSFIMGVIKSDAFRLKKVEEPATTNVDAAPHAGMR